ncbi:MAG: hypothetical protein ABH824_06460 [Nanoarchaeota archaeon]|nr:hypothetical protein [Nanoarchaeota archaeon]MBU1631919.1 hypothetical protein [Nanoarchaeota archaeon]MBU1875941.1 hypothetical protein [Nanoarchaeota archaeon]
MDDKISWCLKQKKGIELVEPNENLCQAYFLDADDSLSTMEDVKKKWKIITGYYACYNALYALLMKTGIKCEIHDCTLELMHFFDFEDEEKTFLKNLKKLRIGVQYYLEPATEINSSKIKSFVTHCKVLNKSLEEDKIKELRMELAKND